MIIDQSLFRAAMLSIAIASSLPGAVHRVDATATGLANGTSWPNAFVNLQDALLAAEAGDEIWVAEGTYTPSSEGDRWASFDLRDRVKLIGGFPPGGGDGSPEARSSDPSTHPTVLSGDLAGNDGPGQEGMEENSLNVITGVNLSEGTALIGFTISAGNANEHRVSDQRPSTGGGLYLEVSELTVAQCLFTNNSARMAAAIGALGSQLILRECTVTNHAGNTNHERPVRIWSYPRPASLLVERCVFSNNHGAIDSKNPVEIAVRDSSFVQNRSHREGSALSISRESIVQVSDSSFLANTNETSGTIHAEEGATVELNGCTFRDNTSGEEGGAVFFSDVLGTGLLSMQNCTLEGNSAGRGGAIFVEYVTHSITGCQFVGNTARSVGGGLAAHRTPSTISSCSLVANEARSGGGVWNSQDGITVSNSILWLNRATDESEPAHLVGSVDPASSDNIVGGEPSTMHRTYNIDPGFVRTPHSGDGDWGTPLDNDYGDLSLAPTSSAIGRGNLSLIPPDLTTDLRGNDRIRGIGVDLGPIESNQLGIAAPDIVLPSLPSGSATLIPDWSPALDGIRANLLVVAQSGSLSFDFPPTLAADGGIGFTLAADTSGAARIRVSLTDPSGRWEPSGSIDFLIRTSGVIWHVDRTASADGDGLSWSTALRDLHNALERSIADDQIWVAEGTYFPAELSRRDFTFALREGVSLYGGFPKGGGDGSFSARNPDPSTNRTILSGDLRRNDAGPEGDNRSENSYQILTATNLSHASLDGFRIVSGQAENEGPRGGGGAGLLARNSNLILSNLRFEEHEAAGAGGALLIEGGQVVGRRLLFLKNRAEGSGGAIHLANGGSFAGSKSAFLHNRTEVDGGAICAEGSTLELSTTRVLGNRARIYGGALRIHRGNETLLSSCAFAGNSAGSKSGAIYTEQQYTYLRNCTIVANTADRPNAGAAIAGNGRLRLFNSIVWGNTSAGSSERQLEPTFSSSSTHNLVPPDTDVPGFVIREEPRFRRLPSSSDGSWATFEDNHYGDLRLQPDSPARDAGTNGENVDSNDLDGGRRLTGTVDLGSYETRANLTSFAALHPGLSPDGDANRNHLSNYYEYAAGVDPVDSHDPSVHPVFALPQVSFTRRFDAGDAATNYCWSDDLRNWSAMTEFIDYVIQSRVSVSPNRQTITIRLLNPGRSGFVLQRFRMP